MDDVLVALNRHVVNNVHLCLHGVTVERLLLTWGKLAVLSNWSSRLRYFSRAELFLLSLILATIATLLSEPRSPSPPKSFLVDYDVRERLRLLGPLELFFAALIVTKQILDVGENETFSIVFRRQDLQLLIQMMKQDEKMHNVSIAVGQFKWMNRALTSLYLFVSDLQHPLGRFSIALQPTWNADDKIQEYLRVLLQRPLVEADFSPQEEFEHLVVQRCNTA